MVIGMWHRFPIAVMVSAQDTQKGECPHETNATPIWGTSRQTLQLLLCCSCGC